MLFKKIIPIILLLMLNIVAFSQETKKDIKNISKEEVLEMSIEELSHYDLEELTQLMDIVGASSLDELYELLLNKDVVSASKKTESQFDSPLSTTVLSNEEIVASGATSIEEALRLVPGIIVREKSNGNFDVHIRGLDNIPPNNMMVYSENSSTLVMIDGRPVFNYAMGGILWETLPVNINDIDRIEVVRGPASALYGPNAVSGAINIISKDIDSESPLFAGSMQGGSLQTYMGDLAFRKQLNDKLSLGISSNYEHRNRTDKKLYLFNERKWYTKNEFAQLKYGDADQYSYLDPKDDINDLFPDADLSKERYAINGYLNYVPSETINVNLQGGYQNSTVLTSTMGDNPTPFSGRESSTGYFNLSASIKGIHFQTNYITGVQDYNTGNEGFEVDVNQLNITAEYDWQVAEDFTVRPGINYTSIIYDDTPHLSAVGNGFFNGKKDMNITAGNLRLDYVLAQKLRLVAALRSEKYSHSDDWKSSWQFVGSYKINENNNVRLVYSRANKSPFLFETETNFDWDRGGRPAPNFMQFRGNKDMDLMTSDMYEFGFRTRPAKNLLIDIEAYYSKGENYTVMSPDSTNFTLPVSMVGMTPTPVATPVITAFMNYQNIPLETTQTGVTISLDWVISKKLIAKSHVTIQKTKLDNFNTVARDMIIGTQANQIYPADGSAGLLMQQIGADAMTGKLPAYPDFANVSATSTWQPAQDSYENDFDHEATPSVWGSIGLDYRPTEKLNIFSSCYYYGEQTFLNQYDSYNIDAKFLLNVKATYKACPHADLFINCRNLLNSKSTEFAFMDETQSLILLGLSFKF